MPSLSGWRAPVTRRLVLDDGTYRYYTEAGYLIRRRKHCLRPHKAVELRAKTQDGWTRWGRFNDQEGDRL